MSSSSPPNVGNIDLESVLNVRRRTLASISEAILPRQQHRYTDTIYLKREDNSNSLLSIHSKIIIFGELQLLCSIFERYTSNINIHEESIESNSTKTSFSTTFEENEDIKEDNTDTTPAMVSKLRQTSISSQSSSSPPKYKTLNSIGYFQPGASITNDYSVQNLEGKHYGSIELPNMTIIEILEILLRAGLELVDESNDYDKENTLHQNFLFSKIRQPLQRLGQSLCSRSLSLAAT